MVCRCNKIIGRGSMNPADLSNARTVLENWTGVQQTGEFPSEWAQPIPNVSEKISYIKLVASYLDIDPGQLRNFLGHRYLGELISKLVVLQPTWSPDQGIPENWDRAGLITAFGATLDEEVSAARWKTLINEYGEALKQADNTSSSSTPESPESSVTDAPADPKQILKQYRELAPLYTPASLTKTMQVLSSKFKISDKSIFTHQTLDSWAKDVTPPNHVTEMIHYFVLHHNKLRCLVKL